MIIRGNDQAGAVFSDCERYRYRLWRDLGVGSDYVAFLMLNPSTATEEVLDPTVRRCLGFARDWGFRRIEVVNLFALRSTNPKGLDAVEDPVGPDNDDVIIRVAAMSKFVVCAWGAQAGERGRMVRVRSAHVCAMIRNEDLRCLARTAGGDPRHPLYLRSDLKPATL